MIPCYLISLPEEPYKWRHAKRHFEAAGLDPILVAGFNGLNLGLRTSSPHDVRENGDEILAHPTQIAVALSHLVAFRFGLWGGHDQFLIAEDDCVLSETFAADCDAIAKEACERRIDVVQLEYLNIDDKPREQISERLARCYYPHGSACSIWNRRAAEHAIQHLRPLCSPIDVLLAKTVYPFVSHAIASPALATQKSHSDWLSTTANKT